MMDTVQVTFYGGVGTVTGANFLLESTKTKLLIDCGILQGTPEADMENKKSFPYDVTKIDYLFLTHAHMDHIGRVCKLVAEGFRGVICSTPETKELAHIMFLDAVKVMEMNARQVEPGTETPKPMYGLDDVNTAMSLWKTIPYHTHTKIGTDFSVYLKNAGHILGSSMYEFMYDGKKIVFTGDSGNSPAPLLPDTEDVTDADYLIIDSVYGDRNHESKKERDEKFRQVVSETIQKGGALVIPAFSLERTQVILYELNNMIEDGKVPSVPVFLDSPLGLKVTDIYKHFTKDFNIGVKGEINAGDDIFNFHKLHITHSSRDSQGIYKTSNPKIIIAGSGMSTGGRIQSHEAQFLPDPNSTILLMGYQAIGTLGRLITGKPKSVEIHGQVIPVRARIESISGYSSHKDSNNLVAMVEKTKQTVKKVFVVMGEPKSAIYLAQRLNDELGVSAICPEKGKVYELQ
jgi:metallo-beta-lactamase family protein